MVTPMMSSGGQFLSNVLLHHSPWGKYMIKDTTSVKTAAEAPVTREVMAENMKMNACWEIKYIKVGRKNIEKDHREAPGGYTGKREAPCQQKARKQGFRMKGEVGRWCPGFSPSRMKNAYWIGESKVLCYLQKKTASLHSMATDLKVKKY